MSLRQYFHLVEFLALASAIFLAVLPGSLSVYLVSFVLVGIALVLSFVPYERGRWRLINTSASTLLAVLLIYKFLTGNL